MKLSLKNSLSSPIDKKIEIEYILANTPTNELIIHFGDLENDDNYKVKLGNLTLPEKPHNIVTSNNYVEIKKDIYKQSNFYLTKSLVQKDNISNNITVTRINNKLVQFDK